MVRKFTHSVKRHYKQLQRKIKHQLYQFLVAIHEGEIRFSFFYIVCTLFVLFLCVGFFFRTPTQKELPNTVSVLGSELTHALRHSADQRRLAEPNADITLFLLPDTEDADAFSSFLDAPLYGFYLTGKEVSYLPEFYTSLSDSFIAGTPYIGGLSFSYNPKRLLYNRATDITLLTAEGSYAALSDNTLYYVVGTESVFSMFHYLSERTFRLLTIQPKDASGALISDYSCRLLRGAHGSQTVSDIYGSYLLSGISETQLQTASEISVCNTLNTTAVFTQLNGAGYFLVGCVVLFLILGIIVQPSLRRVMIWFRIFMFHQKKRGRISLRSRLYTAHVARRRAA